MLRILLGIRVFFTHSSLGEYVWLANGVAVECFFVISGFYLQLILSGKYTRERLGATWWLTFYKARYLRLYPMYIFICGIVLAAAVLRPYVNPMPVWTYAASLPATVSNTLYKGFLALTNSTLLFQDLTMFLSAHDRQVSWSSSYWASDAPLWKGLLVPQAWSLGMEVSFFLLAPVLLNFRSITLGGLLFVALACKLLAVGVFGLGDPWSFRFFPFELGYFLLGALVFRFRDRLDRPLPQDWDRYAAYPLAAVVVVFMVPFAYANFLYPAMIALVTPYLFRVSGRSHLDRRIGEVSYPFYLSHIFVLEITLLIVQKFLPSPGHVSDVLALGMTFLMAGIALWLEARFVKPWRVRLAKTDTSLENRPLTEATS